MTCDRCSISCICNSWYEKSALYLEVPWNKWASVYGEKDGQLNQKQENYSGMKQPQWNKDRIKEQLWKSSPNFKDKYHTRSQTGPAKPLKASGQFSFCCSILLVRLRCTQRLIWVWKQTTNCRGLNDCQ